MPSDTRRVVFDFVGRDRVSQTIRQVGEEAEKLNGQMAAAGASAGALAGPVAAAGAAFMAFAAVAAPSVGKVISAQEDLAENWGTLNTAQRASALMVRGLTDEYKALSRSYEPQTLAAFNSVVNAARGLMPQLDKVVGQTAGSMQGFADDLAGFVGGPQVSGFLDFAGEMAPAALDELGQAATSTGGIALTLIQDMAPLGLSVLQLANGVLSGVNAVAQFNPMLAQLAITTVLLRGPIMGLVGGVGAMGTRMRAAASPTAGLSKSAKLLNLAAAAGPTLYIAAGAAIGIWALKAMNAASSHEKFIDTMRISNRATGNNVAGHQAFTRQLEQQADVLETRVIVAQERMSEKARQSLDPMRAQAAEVAEYRQKLRETSEALEQQRATQQRVETGLTLLGSKYQITSGQAQQLATAAGVDLSQAVDKSGKLSNDAAAKIQSYRLAVDQAKNPTQQVALAMQAVNNQALTLDDRIKGAQQALESYFNPSLAAFNATTQLKSSIADLAKAFGDAKGRMDGTTDASRQARSAFGQTLQSVTELWQATIRKDRTDKNANATLRAQIPVLYSLARGDKDLRAQVDALALSTGNATGRQNISRAAFLKAADAMSISRREAERLWREYSKLPKQTDRAADGIGSFAVSTRRALHSMNDKDLDVKVYAKGEFRRATTAGLNAGGPVPWLAGAEPGKDSVPSMLTPDEHVWTTREVRAAGGHEAMLRLRQAALRGELQGYKVGGAVSFRARTPSNAGLASLMRKTENAHMQWRNNRAAYEMAESLAAVWKKYAGGAGGVVGAARSQIGYPYSWGGGGRGGPSFGIGRGAGTYGYDCSGLTEFAWWRGARVGIGGVTYTQHPASSPIGAPRPGALGFSGSLGHVVLASDKPGYVIEAPYTGAHVREIRKSMPDWRWPRGASTTAGLNAGGRVERLGSLVASGLALRTDVANAKLAQIAGDPGRRRGHGGPVAGGTPYLVGEHAPEVFVPRTAGTVHSAGTRVVHVAQTVTVTIRPTPATNLAAVGREITDALREYKRSGGQLAGV